MENHKIICTGNPSKNYTIANSIKNFFPDTTFIHHSNGFDLTSNLGLELFQQQLSNHSVLLNCSYIAPGIQEKLLNIAREVWNQGHVFNIGSFVEFKSNNIDDQAYLESKKNLRDQSLKLCNDKFKITHITVDGYKCNNDVNSNKMSVDSIAKTIQWILNEKDFFIPFIGVMGNNTLQNYQQ